MFKEATNTSDNRCLIWEKICNLCFNAWIYVQQRFVSWTTSIFRDYECSLCFGPSHCGFFNVSRSKLITDYHFVVTPWLLCFNVWTHNNKTLPQWRTYVLTIAVFWFYLIRAIHLSFCADLAVKDPKCVFTNCRGDTCFKLNKFSHTSILVTSFLQRQDVVLFKCN